MEATWDRPFFGPDPSLPDDAPRNRVARGRRRRRLVHIARDELAARSTDGWEKCEACDGQGSTGGKTMQANDLVLSTPNKFHAPSVTATPPSAR